MNRMIHIYSQLKRFFYISSDFLLFISQCTSNSPNYPCESYSSTVNFNLRSYKLIWIISFSISFSLSAVFSLLHLNPIITWEFPQNFPWKFCEFVPSVLHNPHTPTHTNWHQRYPSSSNLDDRSQPQTPNNCHRTKDQQKITRLFFCMSPKWKFQLIFVEFFFSLAYFHSEKSQ